MAATRSSTATLGELAESLCMTMYGTLPTHGQKQAAMSWLASATPALLALSESGFAKIGALHRTKDGVVHYLQGVQELPIELHATLDVYMKNAAPQASGSEGYAALERPAGEVGEAVESLGPAGAATGTRSAVAATFDEVPAGPLHRPPFAYQWVSRGRDGGHFRIHDANDNALCFCYSEDNAREVVERLNGSFQSPVAVPAGWALVPIDPTPEMLEALRLRLDANAFLAVLAAAPDYAPPHAEEPKNG